MKKTFLLSIAALVSAAVIISGCKKDDSNPEPTPEPIVKYDSLQVLILFEDNKSQFYDDNYHSPKYGDTDCRCFDAPLSIATRRKVYEPFVIKVNDTEEYTYRYQVADYSVTDATGANLAVDYVPTSGTHILINHKDLKPNTQYTMSVTVTIAQLINGEWNPVVYQGSTKDFKCSVSFTTGELPSEDAIDSQDILYQYPIDRQLFYLPEEYKQGYIILGYRYDNIFNGVSEQELKVVITSVSDQTQAEQTTNFTYKKCSEVDRQVDEINYSLENVTFRPNTIYSLEFLCGSKSIYTMNINTSKYPNLQAKIASATLSGIGRPLTYFYTEENNDRLKGLGWGYFDLNILNMDEPFDLNEIGKLSSSIIHMEMDLDNCDWYQNSLYRKIYENYSPDKLRVDVNAPCECPPADNILISTYGSAVLSDEDIANKVVDTEVYNALPQVIASYVSAQMYRDWLHVRLSLMDRTPKNDLEVQIREANTDFNNDLHITLTPGDYPYFFSYRLPGKNIETFKQKYVITLKAKE